MQYDESREDAYINALVAQAPPLSTAQIAQLSALFDTADET